MITIGYSTRKTNPQYQEILKKSCFIETFSPQIDI
jgi:hypothetical protein